MTTLKNKVALVTGGSRGIGAAIARRLAREGADVAISYSASPDAAAAVVREIEKSGGRAAAIRADQSKPEEVEALVRATVQRFGKLDVLVNNAGVFVMGALGDAVDAKAMQHQSAVNVGGVVAAVRAAASVMGAGGRIINIGSVAGDHSPGAGMADYSATKAAVAAYSRGWSRDLGPKNITVNTVQPGPIETDMNPGVGDFADALKARTAAGRFGKPEEVAAAVAFLASPDASYITGAELNVDGGFNA